MGENRDEDLIERLNKRECGGKRGGWVC